MSNPGRVSIIAVALIVALRLAVGWQLFYEGVWKIKTYRSPNPWTSAGYLRNAQGPLRDSFRRMAGDPDDLDWLDSGKVKARWENWKERFVNHYGLSEPQQRRLDEQLNGKQEFTAELASLPSGIGVGDLEKFVKFDETKKVLKVDKKRITPKELDTLLSLAKWDGPAADTPREIQNYRKAVSDLFDRASRLGYSERVVAMLDQNPKYTGDRRSQFVGDVEKYNSLLVRHQDLESQAAQDFQHDHLTNVWSTTQQLRSELVGPIKAMDKELKSAAESMLTVEQLQRGSLGEPWTSLRVTDALTIAGLACLGLLLILGLFSRFAALMAAIMLFSFYMAMPPWPGVPEIPGGSEHSLIVNKNLIEVVALLAIAALPTGYWFGLDNLVRRIFGRKAAAVAN